MKNKNDNLDNITKKLNAKNVVNKTKINKKIEPSNNVFKSTSIGQKNILKKRIIDFNYFLLAIFAYIFFSVSNVLMKVSSSYTAIFEKLAWYSLAIICLLIFSIMWQVLLKKMPLNKAYLLKSTTLFWGMIFGILVFNEKITINMIIGTIIVLIGIFITFIVGEQNE